MQLFLTTIQEFKVEYATTYKCIQIANQPYSDLTLILT